jgi:hypothetical protein
MSRLFARFIGTVGDCLATLLRPVGTGKPVRPRRRRLCLRVEALEDRALLSSMTAVLPPIAIGGTGASTNGTAVAIDRAGDRYVSGTFTGTVHLDATHTLSSGSENAFIAKYSPSGTLLWDKDLGSGSNYALGGGIAVDGSGNVYTTGVFWGTGNFGTFNLTSSGGYSAYVAKLDASGNFAWAVDLGSGSSHLNPGGIAVDRFGNVYTTGLFLGTANFNPAGTFNLTSGSPYAEENAYVSKLDTSGKFVWAVGLGRGSDVDVAGAIAVDGAGNVYTTGSFRGTGNFNPSGTFSLTSSGDSDAYVAKLNASGKFVWAAELGRGSWWAAGSGISVDSAGDVYTTGSWGGPESASAYVSKLDAAGKFVWAADISPNNNFRFGQNLGGGSGIALDSLGNLYIVGYFVGWSEVAPNLYGNGFVSKVPYWNGFVSKLDASGNFAWRVDLGSGSTFVESNDIVVDSSGNLYITGRFAGTGDFSGLQNGSGNLTASGTLDGYVVELRQDVTPPTIGTLGAPSAPEGSTLTITGTGFTRSSVVQFNGVNVTTTFVSSTRLSAIVPDEGSYTVNVNDPGNGTSNGVAFTSTDAPLSEAKGVPTTTAGTSLHNAVLATFTDTNPNAPAAEFPSSNLVIDWGDGSATSNGVIKLVSRTATGSTWEVLGSHAYRHAGKYTITVQIGDIGGSSTQVATTVKVHGERGIPLDLSSGNPHVSGAVGFFTDTNLLTHARDYQAVIAWGDGSISNATFIMVRPGVFEIAGSHTYRRPGKYRIKITITDKNDTSSLSFDSEMVIERRGRRF